MAQNGQKSVRLCWHISDKSSTVLERAEPHKELLTISKTFFGLQNYTRVAESALPVQPRAGPAPLSCLWYRMQL